MTRPSLYEVQRKDLFGAKTFCPNIITPSTSTELGFDMNMSLHHHPPTPFNHPDRNSTSDTHAKSSIASSTWPQNFAEFPQNIQNKINNFDIKQTDIWFFIQNWQNTI